MGMAFRGAGESNTLKPLTHNAPPSIAGPSRQLPQSSPRYIATPTMEASQAGQEEYADLLMGLDDDDLNDFDGLDDFGDDLDEASQQMHLKRDQVSQATAAEQLFRSDLFNTSHAIPTASFTTGKGKPVAPPSNAALERVKKMFEEVEKEISTVEQGTAVVHLQDTPNKRRKLDQEDHQDDEDLLEIPAPDFVMTESAGFVTGKGKAVPPPSKAAMEKALKIIAAVEEEKEDITTDEPIVMPPKAVSSFTTGSGNAVAAPSSAALAAVGKLFEDDEPPTSTQGLQHAAAFATPAKPSGFTTGSGAPATMMSEATRLKAMAIFGEDNPGTPTKPTSTMLPPTSTPFRPLVQHTTTPQRPTTSAEVAVPPATAFRTPLRTTTNTFPSQPTSTLSRMTKALKPIEIKTPAPHRRVGLGRTPTSTNRGKVKNSFSTPFKMPGKSSDSPLKSAAPLRTSGMASTSSALSRGPAPLPAKIVSVPVFDLANVPSERKNMKDAFLHPQYNAIDELKELGFPDEIWLLDLTNAGTYQFIAEDATVLNRHHALTIIQRDGCALATSKWVDNHWSQILWKIAGQVQAKPALFDQKWNWGEVIAQLKYRYEREYGSAQRPIIRRIQEHDSSSSLPMILCVAAVHHPSAQVSAEDDGPPPRPYLELTEGWYKILAEVDDCLARAIIKGKICVGRKLAISGAKLDSGSEGADVLDAFDKSRLIISGNSSSLARWHAKLGVQREPYIAGLSSLSVDGGSIVLMDVIVEKLYPVAFVSSVKGSKEGPWDEGEEQIRSDQWRNNYLAESTSLREKMRKQLESIEDLVETLCSAAQDVSGPISNDPPETLDRDYDNLINCTNASVKIRNMSGSHIVHLARYSRERLQQDMTDGNADIERELQTVCPPREIRDFRMARIVDAREGDRDATRVGMLNIWEAKSLGEGMLREGGRYLVSSLMPARQGDWGLPTSGGSTKEIYLHTRRDTRWQEVGVSE